MNEIQTFEIKNALVEYNGVIAQLNRIKAMYDGRVYDVTTKQGMADAKLARREVREARTGLEKLRKEIKAPAWARCKDIDSQSGMITEEFLKIEDPIDALISAEETRVQREKEEAAQNEALRVSMIRERIERFNVMPPWGASAAQISARLHEVNDIPVDDSFQEFTETAAVAKAQAITRLSTLAEEARVLEAEQAKLRALAEEQAAKMAAERAEHEARLAEERAKAEAERQERIAAQKKLDEAAANERDRLSKEAQAAKEQQEKDRLFFEANAKKAREESDAVERAAAEAAEQAARDLALEKAKAHSSEEALQRVADIVALWLSDQIDAEAAMDEIEVIVAANA